MAPACSINKYVFYFVDCGMFTCKIFIPICFYCFICELFARPHILKIKIRAVFNCFHPKEQNKNVNNFLDMYYTHTPSQLQCFWHKIHFKIIFHFLLKRKHQTELVIIYKLNIRYSIYCWYK